MRRILLDESVPAGIAGILTGHEVRTAPEMGWAGLTNGRLLDEAERAGFSIMVTADSNIKGQQRLAGRKIALVVLTNNHWDTIRANPDGVRLACDRAKDGDYIVVDLPRPPLRRRPFPAPAP
jgi:hypothetical protein